MLKDYLKKNIKYVKIAAVMFAILHIGCLIPFIITGIIATWDIYIYLNYVVIFGVVLLCIALVYREFMINSIRKKTKNWVDPLNPEDKAKYQTFVKSVMFETIATIIVYLLVAMIDYSIMY